MQIEHTTMNEIRKDLANVISALEFNSDDTKAEKKAFDELAVARLKKYLTPGSFLGREYEGIDWQLISNKWGAVAILLEAFLSNITASATLPLSNGRSLSTPAASLPLYAAEMVKEGGNLLAAIDGFTAYIERIYTSERQRLEAAAVNVGELLQLPVLGDLLRAYVAAIERANEKDASGAYNDGRDVIAIGECLSKDWLINGRPSGSSATVPECLSGRDYRQFARVWAEYQRRCQDETTATESAKTEVTPEPEPQPKRRGRVA